MLVLRLQKSLATPLELTVSCLQKRQATPLDMPVSRMQKHLATTLEMLVFRLQKSLATPQDICPSPAETPFTAPARLSPAKTIGNAPRYARLPPAETPGNAPGLCLSLSCRNAWQRPWIICPSPACRNAWQRPWNWFRQKSGREPGSTATAANYQTLHTVGAATRMLRREGPNLTTDLFRHQAFALDLDPCRGLHQEHMDYFDLFANVQFDYQQ